jgi:hypothetical protein
MAQQSFFLRESERFIPTPACRGPWSDQMLHGRVVVGLLGFQIERRHGHCDFIPARLTVDMYRTADFSPIEVHTKVVRDGHRIKVVDAELVSNNLSIGRASCQLLRRTANPAGKIWSPPEWDAPAPETLTNEQLPVQHREPPFRIRNVRGEFGRYGQRAVWMSEVRPLVEGCELTPFVRAALAADFASPCANSADGGLSYINTDATLQLHRLPRGEWIGMETAHHGATDGVAVGECRFYDVEGAIGACSVVALGQKSTLRG